MPIFCNYGEVEVAAQETGQFKLAKIKLDGESPRKWYKSSVSKKYRFIKIYTMLEPKMVDLGGIWELFWNFPRGKFSDFVHESTTWQFGVAGSAKVELG